MRLLVADKMEPQVFEELKVLGIEIVYKPSLPRRPSRRARRRRHPGRPVDRGHGERHHSAKQLNLIVRAGAGVNTIDVAAASARGIYVANCPGKNAIAVAELTMGFILALDRRIPEATADLRAGRWEKTRYSAASGLYGRRIGIAGLGSIGREVLARVRSFGLQPHAWSRSLTPGRAAKLDVGYARSLEELASRSDVLSVHLPLTHHTRGIVGRSVIEALPDGAILVNTARHEVLDYEALAELIPKKNLKVGLDVFAGEPEKGSAEFEPPILKLGTTYGTPHIGASTEQAQRAIAMETARIIRSFLTRRTCRTW
jgi:D-3-phosphoglycerate dehydrogenase